MKKLSIFITSLLIFSLVTLSGCADIATKVQPTPPQIGAPSQPVVQPQGNTGLLAAFEGTLENIYLQINPSVVNIRVVEKTQAPVSIFPEIPGFPFFNPPSSEQPPELYRQGLGSGFVWDKQGYIVTNNHVVEGADKIEVTFSNSLIVPAKLVGADPDSDLAVIKADVPVDELHPVQLVDSQQIKVGQLAIAIGNPFGLQGTMTVGIVSAVGRTLPTGSDNPAGPAYSIPDIIQTDAPINPGNSGGILVNDQGQVIGVTSAIESPVQANAGIGFAIPSSIVQKVVPALIKNGKYEHSWLGISGTTLTPDLAKVMGLDPEQQGALVEDVVPGSPADKAGLRGSDRQVTIEGQGMRVGGDVVKAIDEQPVNGMDDLIAYLTDNTEVGQKVVLTVLRNGKEETVNVTLAVRPKSENQVSLSGATRGAWLGISGITVTPGIAQAMGLPADQQGVLIDRVEQGSPADKADLRGSYKPLTIGGQRLLIGGDIIAAIGGQPITTLQDLRAILQQSQPGQEVILSLIREGDQIQVSVTLGELPLQTP